MKSKDKGSGTARATMIQAVAYARVSSKEQEKEGFSIPAQQKVLHGYAGAERISVVKEYIDVETAKHSGRTNFEEMVRFLKRHPNIRTVLVEKPTASTAI